MNKDEIDKIKKNIEYWGNNCGGCETCSRLFGDEELTFDMTTVYDLILVIEAQAKQLETAETELKACYQELGEDNEPS